MKRPLRIVDTHHHFWDLSKNYYPWLTDRVVVKPYGDYTDIRRNYLPADLLADVGDLPIVRTVHLNAGHDRSDPVRETRWLQTLASSGELGTDLLSAIVADADLSIPNIAPLLAEQATFPLVRGIRVLLNESVRYPGEHQDLLKSEVWRGNLALLPRFDMSLDLQLYPQQMMDTADLARQHPLLKIMINHAGLPEDRSADGRKLWRAGLSALASAPNVALKISGFGLWDQAWTTEIVRSLVLEAVDIFGPDRCMFGSNFPVDRLFASYTRIWQSFIAATEGFSNTEVDAMFYRNAVRLYRLQ